MNGKKRINSDIYIGIGFLGMIFSGIMCLVLLAVDSFFELQVIFAFLLICSIIIFFMGLSKSTEEDKREKAKVIQNMNEFQHEYDEYINKLGIVERKTQVTLIELNKYGYHSSIPQYLWIENNCINLFPMSQYYKQSCTSSISKPDVSMLQLKTIPIDKILYFEEMGELRKYTTVSGGGSSFKGALLGYVLADDIGAIIGSRKPIETKIVSEDDRKVELIYRNEDNEVLNLEFTHDAYDVLKEMIPSKELRRIAGLNISSNMPNGIDTQKSISIKEKLKQLNDLKAEGLINDEEFSEQKQKILDLL